MKKKITKETIDYGTTLMKIRIEEDEVTSLSELSNNSRQSLIDLLNIVVHDPSSIEYGQTKTSKIEIINESGKWILISTLTIVEK